MSEENLSEFIIEELRKFREGWTKFLAKEMRIPNEWEDFTGLRNLFDESIWDLYFDYPKSFTPNEFNEWWNSLSNHYRIEYVRNQITDPKRRHHDRA